MQNVLRFFRRNWKWFVALACLALFVAIAEDLLENELTQFDTAVYQAISRVQSPPVTVLMKLVTNLAHPVVLAVITLLLLLFFCRRAYRLAVLCNLVLEVLLNLALKAFFLRGRPVDVAHLINETGYSFPSGHAMAATAFYGLILFLLWESGQPRKRKWLGTAGLLLTIAVVCVSRVYLGVHYASDVLAGCAFSGAYLVVFMEAVKRYLSRGESEEQERGAKKGSGSLVMSFQHAFEGVHASIRAERNLLIHFSAVVLVVLFGFLFRISKTEWLVCIVLFGLVIALELLNTAVEAAVDLCSPEPHPLAKTAKDAAAGAVLVAAAAAVIAGGVIFLPRIWQLLLGVMP